MREKKRTSSGAGGGKATVDQEKFLRRYRI